MSKKELFKEIDKFFKEYDYCEITVPYFATKLKIERWRIYFVFSTKRGRYRYTLLEINYSYFEELDAIFNIYFPKIKQLTFIIPSKKYDFKTIPEIEDILETYTEPHFANYFKKILAFLIEKFNIDPEEPDLTDLLTMKRLQMKYRKVMRKYIYYCDSESEHLSFCKKIFLIEKLESILFSR